MDSSKNVVVATLSRSPTCGPSQAPSPRARQNVFLSSAPQPSVGRGTGSGKRDRSRHVAARPAQYQGRAGEDARHRVVAGRRDVAVVHEEEVGESAQPRERLLVAVRERFVGEVARRHHERDAGRLEQQVVQRL